MPYLTCFVLKGNEEKIREKLEKIAEKDETFKFEIKNGILRVESSDRNIAHRRGLWLKHKIEELNKCGYEIMIKKA